MDQCNINWQTLTGWLGAGVANKVQAEKRHLSLCMPYQRRAAGRDNPTASPRRDDVVAAKEAVRPTARMDGLQEDLAYLACGQVGQQDRILDEYETLVYARYSGANTAAAEPPAASLTRQHRQAMPANASKQLCPAAVSCSCRHGGLPHRIDCTLVIIGPIAAAARPSRSRSAYIPPDQPEPNCHHLE